MIKVKKARVKIKGDPVTVMMELAVLLSSLRHELLPKSFGEDEGFELFKKLVLAGNAPLEDALSDIGAFAELKNETIRLVDSMED